MTAIDRAERAVSLDDGSTLSYGGSCSRPAREPRRLPLPARAEGASSLRDLADAVALRAKLVPGRGS